VELEFTGRGLSRDCLAFTPEAILGQPVFCTMKRLRSQYA